VLFIVFQLGQDRYALDARQLVEILPLVQVKRLPQAPAGVAGMLDYRGVALPVIDLTAMALGHAAAERISTRILIAELASGRRLALIAERANEMLYKEPGDFVESGVAVDSAPYLGPVTRDARGLVQWIKPEQLLSPAVRDALFQPIKEAA
jgi:chemotaxis-related protein WspB